QVVHDSVQQLLNTFVFESSPAEHRRQLDGDRGFAYGGLQFFIRDRITMNEFLEKLLIGFGCCLDKFVAVLMDGVRVICRDFFDREFGPESFVAENDGFVFDQIDDAAEPVFGSERKLDRNRFGVKPATHHVHASLIVRAGTIHLVDESNAGNAIFIRLPPYGFRLGLDATHGAEYGDGAIQNTQRTLDLSGEINMTGRINNIDAV